MDVANQENGLVVGTGDLSELALLVHLQRRPYEPLRRQQRRPETFVRHLVSWYAETTDNKTLPPCL